MGLATRERIVEAGVSLFRRQGWAGTGMKAIAAEAKAPFGSIYHFFPGGKDELTAEVIAAAARAYGQLVPAFFDSGADVAAATRAAFDGAGETLTLSGYADACPIATIALEVASTNERLRIATDEAFDLWRRLLADRYAAAGIARDKSERLATAFVVNLEGAFMLCRAGRNLDALQVARDLMVEAVNLALSENRSGG